MTASYIHIRRILSVSLLVTLGFIAQLCGVAETIAVRHTEGVLHGFLALRDMQRRKIADGEISQHAEGERVTARLVFRFKDGSIYDDVVVFSQRGRFQMISDHLIEKGPSFKKATDTYIDAPRGQVKIRYTDDHGNEKLLEDKVDIPPDLANGMLPILMKNIPEGVPETLSMLVTTPKPRMVKLNVSVDGQEPVLLGGTTKQAIRYVIKIDIGGVTGLAAKVVGKQPSDIYVWILKDQTPGFLKMQGQLYEEGPIWQMEFSTPSWPKTKVSSR